MIVRVAAGGGGGGRGLWCGRGGGRGGVAPRRGGWEVWGFQFKPWSQTPQMHSPNQPPQAPKPPAPSGHPPLGLLKPLPQVLQVGGGHLPWGFVGVCLLFLAPAGSLPKLAGGKQWGTGFVGPTPEHKTHPGGERGQHLGGGVRHGGGPGDGSTGGRGAPAAAAFPKWTAARPLLRCGAAPCL